MSDTGTNDTSTVYNTAEVNKMKKYLQEAWQTDKKGIWSILVIVGMVMGYGADPALDMLNDFASSSVDKAIQEHIEEYHSHTLPVPDTD